MKEHRMDNSSNCQWMNEELMKLFGTNDLSPRSRNLLYLENNCLFRLGFLVKISGIIYQEYIFLNVYMK